MGISYRPHGEGRGWAPAQSFLAAAAPDPAGQHTLYQPGSAQAVSLGFAPRPDRRSTSVPQAPSPQDGLQGGEEGSQAGD